MADTVTIYFAGSTIEADVLSTGGIVATVLLPSGAAFGFIDTTGSIPTYDIESALELYPQDSAAITSIVAQWPQLSSSLKADAATASTTVDTPTPVVDTTDPGIAEPPTTTTYYENNGETSTSVETPAPQKNADASEDPGVKPSSYYDPADPTTPFSPNQPIDSFSRGSINVNPSPAGSAKGLVGAVQAARAYATAQDQSISDTTKDWRVKLTLGSGADYLYNSTSPGILAPLKATEGVIFPYTPQISVAYASNYDASDITHSNYKIFQYKSSSVDTISVTCDFTAQDTYEANYLLAVIHFLRSVTKMFYGQDQSPKQGTPPPICFLTGLGQYQFNEHPLLISNFTYNLPTDVDYVRADVSVDSFADTVTASSPNLSRLTGGIQPGGVAEAPRWVTPQNKISTPTYVPTKMQISFQAHPLVTRNDISNNFSLKQYATGSLLRRGIW